MSPASQCGSIRIPFDSLHESAGWRGHLNLQYRYAHETISCDFTLSLERTREWDPSPFCTILRQDSTILESDASGRDLSTVNSDGSVVIHSQGEALLVIDRSERVATVALHEGYPPERFEALVLDWVLPYVLTVFGRIVFHATGARIGEKIVGFAGASGSGKSTLAVACAMDGSPLVADDTFVVDDSTTTPTVTPSYPGARLRTGSIEHFGFDVEPASETPTRIKSAQLSFSDSKADLGAILLLDVVDPSASVCLREPEPFDLALLIEQMYLIPDGVAVAAERAARLLEQGFVRVLSVPRDLDRLSEVVSVVRDYWSD